MVSLSHIDPLGLKWEYSQSTEQLRHNCVPVGDWILGSWYMPVGAVIDKKKWEFSYTVSGQLVDCCPANRFCSVFLSELLILSGSYLPEFINWKGRRRKATRAAPTEAEGMADLI
jgi:hypothetical protein